MYTDNKTSNKIYLFKDDFQVRTAHSRVFVYLLVLFHKFKSNILQLLSSNKTLSFMLALITNAKGCY